MKTYTQNEAKEFEAALKVGQIWSLTNRDWPKLESQGYRYLGEFRFARVKPKLNCDDVVNYVPNEPGDWSITLIEDVL